MRRSVTQSRPAPPALGEVTAEMFSKRDKDDQMKATVTLLQVRRRDPPNPLRSRPVPDQAQLTPQRFKKKYYDVRVRPRADASIDPPLHPSTEQNQLRAQAQEIGRLQSTVDTLVSEKAELQQKLDAPPANQIVNSILRSFTGSEALRLESVEE